MKDVHVAVWLLKQEKEAIISEILRIIKRTSMNGMGKGRNARFPMTSGMFF